MIKKAIYWLLGLAGRKYQIDSRISDAVLLKEIVGRSSQLVRGLVFSQALVFRGRNVRIRNPRNVRFGRLSSVGEWTAIDGVSSQGVSLGAGSKLGRYVTVTGTSHLGRLGRGLSLGERSGIGDFAHIGCAGGVTIGRDVIVGPFVSFHSQEHNIEHLETPIRDQGTRESPILIEDNVWVGARVTFLAGSKVGTGCVVAAGSVVRGEFPPNSIIAGVPAKVVKQR